MANDSGALFSMTEGGVVAEHPAPFSAEVVVAPTDRNGYNQVRMALIPFACWRANDVRFQFDSSAVLPAIRAEMAELKNLLDRHAAKSLEGGAAVAPALSIFGHADPVGQDDYNKFLSGRRAAAIYGMLTRRTEIWEDLYRNDGKYTHPVAGDQWGLQCLQVMLAECGYPPGNSDGVMDEMTNEAVRAFQADHGLAVDGDPGPLTRNALFQAYMDLVCVDAKGTPFTVQPGDFLGQAADPQGKADFQGCGEFNPVLLFSSEENAEYSKAERKTERDRENAPNRRVVIYLFRPGIHADPSAWPCSRAREGFAECRKRFWSDGEKRRSFAEKRRKYSETRDTFACRFYDRVASRSPCELEPKKQMVIRLFDVFAKPIPNAPYRILCRDRVSEGEADNQGYVMLSEEEEYPVPSDMARMVSIRQYLLRPRTRTIS
jgi:outer membrane protein OmpA-like peptidoglycan-associated protein